MKTFRGVARPDGDGSTDLAEALRAMAEASVQGAGGTIDEKEIAYVALVQESDIADAIARQLHQASILEKLKQREQHLINILTAILKEFHAGRLRLTQSQLDEANGWVFDAGPGQGFLQLSVKPAQRIFRA